MADLFVRFLDHMQQHAASIDGILIAFSGGLDSTVLLDLLNRSAPLLGFELAAMHVDHGLRSDSSEDARFCARTAQQFGISFSQEKLLITKGGSTQQRARLQRYAALFAQCQAQQLSHVATAHHADDVLETALLNWARGTGIQGLVSLSSTEPSERAQLDRYRHAPELIRPLIEFSRNEILDYAKQRDLSWHEDPTNISDIYTRNHIRHRVIPTLYKLGHGEDPLHASLRNFSQETAALRYYAHELYKKARLDEPGWASIAFSRPALCEAPPACVAMMLRMAMENHPGFHGNHGLNHKTLSAVLSGLSDEASVSEVKYICAHNAVMVLRRDRLVIHTSIGRGLRFLSARQAVPIEFAPTNAGGVPWFAHHISWRHYDYSQYCETVHDHSTICFDADLVPTKLCVRAAHSGERMRIMGMRGQKRISALFQEAKVPADIRWRWPCVSALINGSDTSPFGECLWLCGVRASSHFTISPSTQRVLELRFQAIP